jgi:hypothetical protein
VGGQPSPGTWTSTGPLNTGRAFAATATLPDGEVLVAGGGGPSGALASAEIWGGPPRATPTPVAGPEPVSDRAGAKVALKQRPAAVGARPKPRSGPQPWAGSLL